MTAILSSLGPITINGTTLPVLSLTQNFAVISEASEHTGQLYPTATLVRGATPSLTAQMPFAAAYALIGLGSLNVTSLDVWLAKYGSDGAKSTSTDHTKLSLTASCTGLACIRTISVAQDGLLLADVEIALKSNNGTAHPLTAGTGTLAALSAQPTLHTMGPVALANTVYDGAQGWSVDLGQRLESIRSDGDLYPTVVVYRGGMPSISVDHQNPSAIAAALDLIGESASTTTVLYARQHDATSGIVVGGTTAVSITLAGGFVQPDSIAAAQSGVASIPLTILAHNASPDVHPLTVSVSATAP